MYIVMQNLTTLSRADLLDRASKHYFSLGVDDGASSLCKENFKFGLAKLHYAQEQLGMKPNATFISTPDETISRNKRRWLSGYGYGGKLSWGDNKDTVIFIDTKPNACGMLVGGLDELPKPEQILQNINSLNNSDLYYDNIKIKLDFKTGNHFIDVFKTEKEAVRERNFPPFMFVSHGSAPELKGESEKGLGLYYDKSPALRAISKKIDTPFGPALYLEGNEAKEYMRFFLYAKNFAAIKREIIAEKIFGKFKKISNPMHQGMHKINEVLLGAQHIDEEKGKIFPVCLRSDLPTYLVTTVPNLTEEQIDILGFESRAKKYDLLHRLTQFNALPHGGGYEMIGINRVKKVLELDGDRYFVCEQVNEDAITIINDPSENEFVYRGKKIINKIENLKLGTIVAHLYPRFILKV